MIAGAVCLLTHSVRVCFVCQQASDIKMRAKTLIEENQELMTKVQNQTDEANRLLVEGDGLNQVRAFTYCFLKMFLKVRTN